MNKDVNSHILVVEDDADINGLLVRILSGEGYRVTTAYSGSEARLLLGSDTFDLILLDLMLPGVTGEALIEEIRSAQTLPIIVISAKGMQDMLHVMKIGADDYITKPFHVEEVLARVEAQLRRYMQYATPKQEQHIYRHLNMELDADAVTLKVNEEQVALTAHEFSIMKLLLQYPHKVFTRANLFETIWGDEYYGDDNTINVHISNIRNKLAKVDEKNKYIKTVWGVGFKLEDSVQE